MRLRLSIVALLATALLWAAAVARADAARPEGTLTVAVATFAGERWLPQLYPGAEDVVLKPMFENLLTRDHKTGELAPMLAERWQVLEGGRPKVGEWPVIPGHMGFHNWKYVSCIHLFSDLLSSRCLVNALSPG